MNKPRSPRILHGKRQNGDIFDLIVAEIDLKGGRICPIIQFKKVCLNVLRGENDAEGYAVKYFGAGLGTWRNIYAVYAVSAK